MVKSKKKKRRPILQPIMDLSFKGIDYRSHDRSLRLDNNNKSQDET